MTRIKKAKELAKLGLIGVLQEDKQGRPKVLRVPGSNGRSYQVIIRRSKKGIFCECSLEIGNLGHVPCEGNRITVCYHSISALSYCAERVDKKVSFHNFYPDAKNYSNLGGTVHEVKSWNGGRSIWMVVR